MSAEPRDFAVRHKLDRVVVDLDISDWPRRVVVKATGRSETKRGNLWLTQEVFEERSPYGPYDAASHIILACLQDRPRNDADLHRALRGGVDWEDIPLLF